MFVKDQVEPIRLRVLISGPLPPPFGGIATYFQNLLRSSLSEKVNLQFVETSTHRRDLAQSGRATISNFIFAFQDCVRFFRAVLSRRYQICHITTAFGLSFIKNSVCVAFAHLFCEHVLIHPRCSLSALYPERSIWWRWYFRQVIRLTDGVIGLSSEWKQLPRIVPGSRVYILHNAIDLTPYKSIAKDRLENPRQNGIVNILYLGYLGQAKGSLDLLEAASYMDCEGGKISFDLVGDELRPGELDQLRQDIERANLKPTVNIRPPVMDEEKLACFRNADIFVYPSYSEGMPMAVIEAMASGLPVVASNVGGLPDLVLQGVNGLLVDPGRPKQLADALLKITVDAELRRSMQEKSSQIAGDHYDIERHVLKLVEIYAQCI